MDTMRIPEAEHKMRRMERVLAEAEMRFRHELLDHEERMMLQDRIGRLRRSIMRLMLADDPL